MPADHELAPRVVTIETDGQPRPPHPTRGAVRRLWVICALLVGSALLISGQVIWREHQNAYAVAERELSNLGVVLAEQTSRTVQSVDLIVQAVQSRVSSLDVQSPDEFRVRFGGEAAHQFLLGNLRNLPQADAIALIDSSGTLLNWSRDQPTQNLDLSDRDYFVWLRDHEDQTAFVGLPSNGRATGKHMMFIARRINNQRGDFLGVVLGLINTRFLEESYSTISMVPGESVTLLHRDGIVFAGHPDIENRRGKRMPQQSPWYVRVAQGGGFYHSPGYLSDIKQIITVNPLHDYPLVVDVNMSEAAALRDWHQQIIGIGICTMTVALGLVVMFAVIINLFRRQEIQHTELRAFAEMSFDWFWEQDAEFRFLRDPTLTLAGLPSDAGNTRWDVADPAMDKERWNLHRADLAARKPFRSFRWERIHPDGSRHYLSSSGDPIFDEKGIFIGYRGTGRDITTDVETANELRTSKDKADAANRAKSEFLANMGHELRTPLHAIIGFSELIQQQDSARRPDYVEWASEILGSGRQLLDIINNVLELSRIEVGRYELREESIDLAMIARGCCTTVKPIAQANQVGIECNVRDARLFADRRVVQKIITNLLSNAVKFTPAGGSISVCTEHIDGGMLALAVTDTGIGIDEAALASIGEPFVQVDGSKSRRYGGTGLGLAITKKFAELHGARLLIDSALHKGTTVRVVFPANRVTIGKHVAVFAPQASSMT
jgi:signal transduction histidine kinase